MTMKLGLEKHLKQCFPQIKEVRQGQVGAPPLLLEEVEKVIDTIRPFIAIANAQIDAVSISEGILQPTIQLRLTNLTIAPCTPNSIKAEIIERLKRHFGGIALRVEWL